MKVWFNIYFFYIIKNIMKIYCDVSVQYKRFHNLLECSIKNKLLDDIEFTNNIKDCDLIIILFNSGKSLININSIKKPQQKKNKC